MFKEKDLFIQLWGWLQSVSKGMLIITVLLDRLNVSNVLNTILIKCKNILLIWCFYFYTKKVFFLHSAKLIFNHFAKLLDTEVGNLILRLY